MVESLPTFFQTVANSFCLSSIFDNLKQNSNLTLKRTYLFILLGVVVAAGFFLWRSGSTPASLAETMPDVVDYNFHIRPILSDRCFKCHGPDANQRKAELRLDHEAGLFQALKDDPNAHVIEPGKPDFSEMYLRISASDTSIQMPPPNSNLALSEFEVKLIRKWIDQGAKYQRHWAFIAPQKKDAPEVDDDHWPVNDIDRFVLAKMEEHKKLPHIKTPDYSVYASETICENFKFTGGHPIFKWNKSDEISCLRVRGAYS